MEAAHASAPELQETPSQESERLVGSKPERSAGEERRCLATGETLAKDGLIRFVVGPDNEVVPDLAHNLPGRGLWVKANCDAITLAATKGLFSKAAKEKVKPSPDLATLVEKLLRARCLSFVGLAKGAGLAVLGQDQVETALRAKKISLLLLAPDASATLDNRANTPVFNLLTRDELGAALGYAQIVYAGLKPHGLTNRLKAELHRLAKMTEVSEDTSKTNGNGQ
jgi:predicted RNA-binding protein YlxR (DUF448 family)